MRVPTVWSRSERRSIPVGGAPLPKHLRKFVRNADTARRLGKALFWDMAVGSDGVQACASCHFHAGADSRSKNQLNPNITRIRDQRNGTVRGYHGADGAPDELFEVGNPGPSTTGPNRQLVREDFPLVRRPNEFLSNPGDVNDPDASRGNSSDVVSSMGVFRADFDDVNATAIDDQTARFDPIWNVRGDVVRRVEPRHTPSVVNAVLNFTNFWDGRANHFFNGVNPFGQQDRTARIYIDRNGKLKKRRIKLDNGSLASQAVGPPQSFFEMSAGDGAGNVRPWPAIGRKLLDREPPGRPGGPIRWTACWAMPAGCATRAMAWA